MRFKDYSVTQVLVGLHRVGVVGLRDAVKTAAASGLVEREQLVDLMMQELTANNYIPDRQSEAYRTALWRECLRHRGEDFSAYFSPVEVTVRGAPGEERDRFAELVRAVFAGLELRPVIAFEAEAGEGPGPQLVIGGEIVARGKHDRRRLDATVRRTLSDW